MRRRTMTSRKAVPHAPKTFISFDETAHPFTESVLNDEFYLQTNGFLGCNACLIDEKTKYEGRDLLHNIGHHNIGQCGLHDYTQP